jgi:hypothetical protein
MIDMDQSIELLASSAVPMQSSYAQLRESFRPGEPPPGVVMSTLAGALVSAAGELAPEEIAAVSDRVESILGGGTAPAKDAVATGFLEALVSADELAKADAIRAALGPLARAYCAAWDAHSRR